MATERDDVLIRVENVKKWFDLEVGVMDRLMGRDAQPVKAVDGVDMEIHRGDVMGIAGESGCGKTTLGKLLVKLYNVTEGTIEFDGRDITELTVEEEKEFRKRVQMIFQDPFESLNPGMTVFQSVAEPLKVNDIGEGYNDRRERVREVLNDVGLAPAEAYMDSFPRELSGGERQRVSIARGLVVDPDFIVADEPVSMLDVSIRAGVLNLMKELQDKYGLTYIFISHDLSLLRYMCDRMAVMYLGNIIEQGDTKEIIEDPKHPYTEALFDAVPKIEEYQQAKRADVSGEVPSPRNPPSGCRFNPRCPDIIPPDDWQGTQQAFRRLMSFKYKVSRRMLGPNDVEDPSAPPEQQVEELLSVGITLDIPEEFKETHLEGKTIRLQDTDIPMAAQQSLRNAAEAILEEDYPAAEDEMAEHSSVCKDVRPKLQAEGDRQVACHLYGVPQEVSQPPMQSD